ncbi:hypothetical protein PENTCL1PPCAC_13476, partial [Pristionchus entomophagus]
KRKLGTCLFDALPAGNCQTSCDFQTQKYAYSDEKKSTDSFSTFVEVVNYVTNGSKYLPLDFMLGFFVTHVVDRWEKMFQNIGILDNEARNSNGD